VLVRTTARVRRPGFDEAMNSRICRCCGEPMAETGNVLSRNPNVCASCSSMADGMDESGTAECADPACALPASGRREQRASGSPSHPLEERAGERRPITVLDAAVHGDIPARLPHQHVWRAG